MRMTRASVVGSMSHVRTMGVSAGSWLKTLEHVGKRPRFGVGGWV
jgi:hypothetical protein